MDLLLYGSKSEGDLLGSFANHFSLNLQKAIEYMLKFITIHLKSNVPYVTYVHAMSIDMLIYRTSVFNSEGLNGLAHL